MPQHDTPQSQIQPDLVAARDGLCSMSSCHKCACTAKRGAWHSWLILAGTTAISTIGLSSATFALLSGSEFNAWPWRHTETALLASVSCLVLTLVAYLTYQQRKYEFSLRIVNEEKRLEMEQRARADKRLTLLKNTLDNVSHEFRTPLTIIKEYAAGVKDTLSDRADKEIDEFLDIIIGCADDLALMVNDMLDVSRLERNILCMSRKPCRVATILERVRRALERKAKSNGISIQVSIDDECLEAFCDAEKIGRVIINLAVNAIKYSPSGSDVHISARYESDRDQVRIAVRDEGPGIPAADRERIFERFQRVSSDDSRAGFGLGLSIVKELVELSFGEIELETETGRGSTFSFTLPTPEPASLLRRYFERIAHVQGASGCVSLLHVSATGISEPEEWLDVEQFVETQIRRSDLLLKSQWDEWFVVCATDESGARVMTKRLAEARGDREGQHLDSTVDLEFRILGTWRASDSPDDLIVRFNATRSTPAQASDVVRKDARHDALAMRSR